MNKRLKNILLSFLTIISIGGITSCAMKNITSPEDAIIDAYGDKQFRISFDSTNLESPIADMYYSSKNMPTLPTPHKVGYVFDGWYFDNNYVELCDVEDGDLFWKMKNVTLYAKWEVEKIVNNGQYDIEFEAHINEDTIVKGPLAGKYEFYRFDEDIIKDGTYIEKNENGTFLRLQYNLRTRGPVLGGEDSNGDNFSKQTYTVTDKDNRIDESLSIFDRTSLVQTLYYNIEGLNLKDTITLYIEYYNWSAPIAEEDRSKATVLYDLEFNITRFIGFGAPFMNPKARLEDGIYTLPTHYTELDKRISILDMFHPVSAYLEAENGSYTLYKPLSVYNNDIPIIKPEHFNLRETGYAKEFTYFLCDQDQTITEGNDFLEQDNTFIPSLMKAERFMPVRMEFNGITGEYYYVIDLGKTLDKDIIFLGGSSGAMEEMFNFPVNYRRLCLDYNSLIRLASWPYEPLKGDAYTFKERATLYPGYVTDFKDSNQDFEQYKKYRNAIDYANCFYSLDENGNPKVYSSRVNIVPIGTNYGLYKKRYSFQNFDINYEVFGYDPLKDGKLYSRDYSFSTNTILKFSNSSINETIIGKSFNENEYVSLNSVYKEKISGEQHNYTYEAFEVDDSLNVDFDKKVNLEKEFKFKNNVAILYKVDFKTHIGTTLVILAKKESPIVNIQDKGWTINEDKTITTTKRFAIGDEVTLPNIQYIYHNQKFYLRDLFKYTPDDPKFTDFTRVLYYDFSQDVYTAKLFQVANAYDFIMDTERVRGLLQLVNQFGEFETYIIEFKGISAGSYEVKDGDKVITNGDLKYEANLRNQIIYNYLQTIDIVDESSLDLIPKKLDLTIKDEGYIQEEPINLGFALVYLKKNSAKINNLNTLWNLIKNEPYAVIYLYYKNDFGDEIVYKAQYNLEIEGEGVNSFRFIKSDRAIFTNQKMKFEDPILSNNLHKKLAYGSLEIRKKTGNHYIKDIYDILTWFNYEYYSEVSFKESGTYLLTYNFALNNNSDGNPMFDSNDTSNVNGYVNFSISEEIVVNDRLSDVDVTFVTDLMHPFNLDSKELVGYTITSDDKYQYAKKKYKANDKVKAFSIDAFKETKDTLYRWASKSGSKISKPGVYMHDLNVTLGTLDAYLYAGFDAGSTIKVFVQKDGVKSHYKDVQIRKDPLRGDDIYSIDTNIIGFRAPRGYVVYGWECDQYLFYDQIVIEGQSTLVKSNFHKGQLKGFMELYGDTELTCLLRKPTSCSYEAYDEAGNKLEFMKPLKNDYSLYIGEKYINLIDRGKLKDVLNATCTDFDKTLKYWEVYDNELKAYVKCDLRTLVLLEKYSCDQEVKLRAIFG